MAFDPGDRLVDYWEIAYRLVYADFYEVENNVTDGLRLFFCIVTVFIPLVLLNLLIAVMGDAFDNI